MDAVSEYHPQLPIGGGDMCWWACKHQLALANKAATGPVQTMNRQTYPSLSGFGVGQTEIQLHRSTHDNQSCLFTLFILNGNLFR